MAATIEGIKKLKLELSLEDGVGAKKDSAVPLELISGIGTDGLTDFECLLTGRKTGETLRFQVPGAGAGEFFGHALFQEIRLQLGLQLVPAGMSFQVVVGAIEEVDDRELVRALASGNAHGCGGGCGCGCG